MASGRHFYDRLFTGFNSTLDCQVSQSKQNNHTPEQWHLVQLVDWLLQSKQKQQLFCYAQWIML